mgnify:CR=1 FL=1
MTYSISLNQQDLKPVSIELVKKKKLITVDFDIVGAVTVEVPKKYEERLATVLNNKVPIYKPALIPTINNKAGTHIIYSPFDEVPIEIDDANVVEFLAALLQEDDTLTLEGVLENLVNDKSIKAGEIVMSVEEEFIEASTLIFGDLDLNGQSQLIDKTISLLTVNAKKPKIKAIITGLQNYIFNAGKDEIQKW